MIVLWVMDVFFIEIIVYIRYENSIFYIREKNCKNLIWNVISFKGILRKVEKGV